MIKDCYEYQCIHNESLPKSWNNQTSLQELEEFLQLNWEQRNILYRDEEDQTKQQFLKFQSDGSIKTNKYVGTIIFKGEQLNIYPRVFKQAKDDTKTNSLNQQHLVYNLEKWIEYSNKVDYPFIKMASDLNNTENLKELFVTLYVRYVQQALGRGLYYQYIDREDECTIVKGRIDFKDYVYRRIPMGQAHKFKCNYSSFEFDNTVNRIIKYTCRQLLNTTSKKNQSIISKILVTLNEISDVVCVPQDCDNICLNRMQNHYQTIISMSKIFLLNKTSSYLMKTQESFCFLFPIDKLFEGFVGGYIAELIKDLGGKTYLQESKRSVVERIVYDTKINSAAFKMKHDILVEINNKTFILDAKYKEVSRFKGNATYVADLRKEISQEDIYQILSDIHLCSKKKYRRCISDISNV